MRLLAATIACLLALMTAAAALAAAPAPERRPPPEDFMLLYSRSGGFAPGTRSLTVAPAQFATAAVSQPGGGDRRAVDFRLGVRRIRALESGLRRAHFTSRESPGPSGCADCFEYSFFYLGHTLDLDESQMPPRLGDVVAQLEAIIGAHLRQGA
jgi:hypothetical protein